MVTRTELPESYHCLTLASSPLLRSQAYSINIVKVDQLWQTTNLQSLLSLQK
jgi:hypothetical protein